MNALQLASIAPPELTFIGNKQQQAITNLSARHRDRLEAKGIFPKSVRLGEGRNGRKARILSEVLDWNRARIAERGAAPSPGPQREPALRGDQVDRESALIEPQPQPRV
jgi:predicted DNA-binding transcriptional regulator AlpA